MTAPSIIWQRLSTAHNPTLGRGLASRGLEVHTPPHHHTTTTTTTTLQEFPMFHRAAGGALELVLDEFHDAREVVQVGGTVCGWVCVGVWW